MEYSDRPSGPKASHDPTPMHWAVVYAVVMPLIIGLAANWDSLPADANKWITPLVGVAAIAQAVFAFFALQSLRHARRQADMASATLQHMRDSSKLELRAYVAVSKAHLTKYEVGQSLKCAFVFENVGATPAFDIRLDAKVRVAEGRPGKAHFMLAALDNEAGGLDMAPGHPKTATPERSDEPLTQDEIDRIKRREAALYLYGHVIYRTIHGDQGVTQFSFYYTEPDEHDRSLLLTSHGNSIE